MAGSAITLTSKAKAAQAGFRAAANNQVPIPGQCAAYQDLAAKLASQRAIDELAEDWLAGFEEGRRKEMREQRHG